MHRVYFTYAKDQNGIRFYVGQNTQTKEMEDAYRYELERN